MPLSEDRKPRCRGSRPLVLRGGNTGSEGWGAIFPRGGHPVFGGTGFPVREGRYKSCFPRNGLNFSDGRVPPCLRDGYPLAEARFPVFRGTDRLCRVSVTPFPRNGFPFFPRDVYPCPRDGDAPFPRDGCPFNECRLPPQRGTGSLVRGTGIPFPREGDTLFRGTRATLPRDGCPVTD